LGCILGDFSKTQLVTLPVADNSSADNLSTVNLFADSLSIDAAASFIKFAI
jgi:hypothetical protein